MAVSVDAACVRDVQLVMYRGKIEYASSAVASLKLHPMPAACRMLRLVCVVWGSSVWAYEIA